MATSAGLPRTIGIATWLLLDDENGSLSVTPRGVPFDAGAVVADLRKRRHPNMAWVSSILTGQRPM